MEWFRSLSPGRAAPSLGCRRPEGATDRHVRSEGFHSAPANGWLRSRAGVIAGSTTEVFSSGPHSLILDGKDVAFLRLLFHAIDHDVDLAVVARLDVIEHAVALLKRRQRSLLMPRHQQNGVDHGA